MSHKLALALFDSHPSPTAKVFDDQKIQAQRSKSIPNSHKKGLSPRCATPHHATYDMSQDNHLLYLHAETQQASNHFNSNSVEGERSVSKAGQAL